MSIVLRGYVVGVGIVTRGYGGISIFLRIMEFLANDLLTIELKAKGVIGDSNN